MVKRTYYQQLLQSWLLTLEVFYFIFKFWNPVFNQNFQPSVSKYADKNKGEPQGLVYETTVFNYLISML